MINRDVYDVTIIGGGQAGLTLALQLKAQDPTLDILLLEKQAHPLPEAAHKVGESVVEISSYYLYNMLNLKPILESETPKFGLRFFFTKGDNKVKLEERFELGASDYLTVKAFHIDRGRFENALAKRCLDHGIEFIDQAKVTKTILAEKDEAHLINFSHNKQSLQIKTQWVVDASSRFAMLKRNLKLVEPNRHNVNASWFRIDHAFELDEWSEDKNWKNRVQQPRRYSTNHFMGEGYWLWFIPLANNRTSIGIVADHNIHPLPEIQTLEKSLAWIKRFEPKCYALIQPHLDKVMDFIVLKHFSHGAKQVFSGNRWCITGEAGAFLDPFYSPGGDFIGISNTFISELILKQRQGQDISGLAKEYDEIYRRLYRIFLSIYHRQYPIMGNTRPMSLKIVWDFSVYWGCVAFLFCQGKLTDCEFMHRVDPILLEYGMLTVKMQSFFRDWSKLENIEPPLGFLDYSSLKCVADLNAGLLIKHENDQSILEQLTRNQQFAHEMQEEIIAKVSKHYPELAENIDVKTNHLDDIFSVLNL